jgi:blue copper oxidase
VSQNGRPVDSAQIGWKDVVRVQGPTGILLRFDKLASEETPFMYHCHILEHEDAGMMGQLTSSCGVLSGAGVALLKRITEYV